MTAVVRDVLMCENRSHDTGKRVSTVVMNVGGRYTLAATGDWGLSVVMLRLSIAREVWA
jgi:hypothetical protein